MRQSQPQTLSLETDSGNLEETNLGLVYCTVGDHAKLLSRP